MYCMASAFILKFLITLKNTAPPKEPLRKMVSKWCQYATFLTVEVLKVLQMCKSVIASIFLSLKTEEHLDIPLAPVP